MVAIRVETLVEHGEVRAEGVFAQKAVDERAVLEHGVVLQTIEWLLRLRIDFGLKALVLAHQRGVAVHQMFAEHAGQQRTQDEQHQRVA